MAHKIPKLQYLNTSFTGDRTSGSAVITNIADTTDLAADMVVVGTGVPSGAVILTVDSATQITLDMNATATATSASFDAYFEISFDYPPVETKGEQYDAKENISISLSGDRQVSINYIEAMRDLKFSFVSQTIKDLLDTFFTTHGVYGRDFRYFEDNQSASYITYEIDKLKYQPKKLSAVSTSAYLWEIPITFRRVL